MVVSNQAGARFESVVGQFKDAVVSNPQPHFLYTMDFEVEQGIQFQSIMGFGGAFTDAAGINIAKLTDPKLQELLLRSYYHETGIDYNFGRVNLGGCDFSDRPYTYDDVEGDTKLEHFHLTHDDTEFKIPFLKMAQDIKTNGEIKLFASPWSAPAWMKTNNNLIGKGELKHEYYQLWADYFIR